jgi:hypothetical protein
MMSFRKQAALGALLAAGLMAASGAQAQNTQVGALTCDISAGIGVIVGSQRSMACSFRNSRGAIEHYVGTITRFGLDIGATAGGQMVWSVFAPSGNISRYALAGSYAGASGEATIGAGLGANVLIGGSNRSVALQPLSLQGQAGLNVAVGVANLELRPAQ